jgi:hypothetical protein
MVGIAFLRPEDRQRPLAQRAALVARHAAVPHVQDIAPTLMRLRQRRSVLTVGTGTGVFLEQLAGEVFTALVGVEAGGSIRDACP